MTDNYTKLFSSITESTIWGEPAGTRLVWITFLAKCNKHGEVFGSIPGFARLSNVTLEECEQAIATLLAPDKWSRTPDNEGRRIESIDGGWRILNHSKFDAIRGQAERAEYKRRWDKENRPNRPNSKSRNHPTTPDNPDSNPTVPTPPVSSHVSKSKDQKKKQPSQATASAFEIPDWLDKEVWAAFLEMRKKKRCPPTHRACTLLIAELTKLSEKGHDPVAVLDQSILNSWTDVYPIKTKGATNGTHQPAESASGRAERKGNEHLARLEEAERRGNDPLLAAHGRDLRP